MNRNTLWTEQGIGLEMVELRKKDYLRKFVSHISKDSV